MSNQRKNNVRTTQMTATSSLTVNLGNYNSARIEFSITKEINNDANVDMEQLKQELWNEVNTEVDNQIEDIKNAFKK